MNLRYSLMIGGLLLTISINSQSTIDALLTSVQSNNKTIAVAQQRMEADKALFKTGLSLPDPEFTLDWLKGFPASAGNQTEFIAAQPFDFPSVYKYRKQVASLRTSQTTYAYDQARKEILLEAKLIAIDLVHLNKRKAILAERLVNAERFYENYRRKLDQQDATILEFNKAGMLLFSIRTDLQLVDTEIREQTQKLIELNGGVDVVMPDTIYPADEVLLPFESLEQLIEETDPQLQYLTMQQAIGDAEQKLTKASLLPSFEAGYRYQGLLGQTFHGVHTGVSIPLWGNKHKKNYPLQRSNLYAAMIDEHKVEHYHEIKQLYDQYELIRQSIQTLDAGFGQLTDAAILDKALAAGQITVLEYYLESTIYYESVDRYLELERAGQEVLAELLKYKL
jgi:cobalt-zinc-cadmium efflux system outer membrane protein